MREFRQACSTVCSDLKWFRASVHAAGGDNYQTLINDALRQHVQQKREPLEETLRRVLLEELKQLEQ